MTTIAEMSERDLQEAILQAAKLGGWDVRYHTHDSRRSAAGFPDLVLAHRKRGIVFAELKAEKGRLSIDQRDTLDTLREAAWSDDPCVEVFVWRPSDLDAVAAWLIGRYHRSGARVSWGQW